MRSRLVRRILLILLLLGFALLGGTLGFRLLEGDSWFDAFYLTVTTITTGAYREHPPLSRPGRVFDIFLLIFGTSAIFLTFGAITQTIVEMELGDPKGIRKKRRMIEALTGHFIVCGFGRVGRSASYEFLRGDAPFVVLDSSEARIANASEAGMLAFAADATRDESLRRAGVLKAKGLVAALPTDAENLFVILSAKALNPAITVVTRVSEEEAGEKLRRAGADSVLTPYAVAGREMANVLLRPQVVKFLDFARSNMGQEITIEQVRYAGQGATLEQITRAKTASVLVLAIRRAAGETLFNPSPECPCSTGDFLIVMGERPALKDFEDLLTGRT